MSENQRVTGPPRRDAFSTLRGLVREREVKERCEICSAELSDDHPHLFEPSKRQMMCSCEGCAVTMGNLAATKYRRVPRRVRHLPDFKLSDFQWDSMLIPVGMAFFFYNSVAKQVQVFYPSPAGATESLLSVESWEEFVRDNPILQEMEPDVEALLVNRLKGGPDYYLVPIDRCYELVGLIRLNWRGLSGGNEVWDEIGKFYTKLKEQAT